jgi:stalled ribosome rescue protein Dom34
MVLGLKIRSDVMSASAVVGGIVAVAVVARFASGHGGSQNHAAVKAARELINQAHEWNRMAEQDESALYAMRHAALAVAYANAARLLAPDDAVQRATGVDVHAMVQTAEASLRKKTQRIARTCAAKVSKGSPTSVTWL